MGRPYRIEIETIDATGPSGTYRSKKLSSPSTADADVWSALKSIQSRIDAMRNEVTSLVIDGGEPKSDVRNLDELREVIDAAEASTNTILEAAERIEKIARELSNEGEENAARGEDLAHNVITIFEACHFQDLSGQRITRVIQSLAAIDHRINAMVEAWRAGDLVDESALKSHHSNDPLARGPAMTSDTNVVSQDDVDALFR